MDRVWEVLWTSTPLSRLWDGGGVDAAQGWKWVFWTNLPLALLVIVLVLWLLRPSGRHPAWIDYLGGALIAVSLGALTLGLSRMDVADPLMVGYLLLAGVSLVLFVGRQRAFAYPLLPVAMFRDWAFSAASATHVLVGAALIIGMVTVPLMANTVMGLTPLEGGLWLVRMTAAIPVGAVLGGLVCQRLDYRVPAFLGLAFSSLGFSLMSGWDARITDPTLSFHLAVVGLGFGLLSAPIALAATESVGEENRGTAAAMVTASRMIGMTLGLAALTAWGSSRFIGLVADYEFPFQLRGEAAARFQERLAEYEAQVEGAGMTVFNEFFLIAMSLCLVAMVPAARMAWRRSRPI